LLDRANQLFAAASPSTAFGRPRQARPWPRPCVISGGPVQDTSRTSTRACLIVV
jgi:hypothetical protein